MATNVEQNGEFQCIYGGPQVGFHTMLPENLLPDNASPATSDFMFRNGEIRSRPAFGSNIPGPVPTHKIVAGGDYAGTLWCISSPDGFYTYNFGSQTWTLAAGSAAVVSNYISSRVFAGILYITNGIHLSSWDGTTFILDNATLAAGPVTLGGVFLDELDAHLVLVNTGEHNVGGGLTGDFGNRIRWSATGLPATWDPTANVNAGFNDFIEVPDGITGVMMLGRVGYILRTDGITEMAPTGRGQAPFEFNHLWASANGVGNTKFFVSAQYGTTGVIISRDNLYSIISYQIAPIGGGARDQILNDLGQASAATGGTAGIPNCWGVLVPYFNSSVVPDSVQTSGRGGQVPTFAWLSYMLFLNIGNNCKVWIYCFDENNWTTFTLPNVNVTSKPFIATGAAGIQQLYVPIIAPSNNATSLATFSPGTSDAAQGSTHSFKVEDIVVNYVPTVRRVILTYRDLGKVSASVTVTGTDDTGAVVTTGTVAVSLGTIAAPGILKTVFIDLEMTGYRPQLTITRVADGTQGVLSISTATMIGRVDGRTTL